MSSQPKSYKQNFVIKPHAEGKTGIFKDIGRLVQDTSTEHSIRSGVSITALQAANLTWVLADQQFLLLRVPEPGEEIEIETWPSALSKIICRRDFTIRSKSGEVLGHSLTDWVVANLQTRKAERVPDFICNVYSPDEHFAMPELSLKPGRLPENTNQAVFTAESQDIDINEHVTSTRYVDFMLDTVYGKEGDLRRPLFYSISYRAESLEGDRIESRIAPADFAEIKTNDPNFASLLPAGEIKAYWHNLIKKKKKILFITKEEEKELTRGISLWIEE